MSQSISYYTENAIADLLVGIAGVNVYPSNQTNDRLYPYISIKADINDQMLGNYTGVYDISVQVNYSDTATKISQENFDIEYCNIFEAFYSESPTLKDKLNAASSDLLFYMARIAGQSPSIKIAKRAWQRGITISIYATPAPVAPSYLASLDFSDHRNSMYLGVI